MTFQHDRRQFGRRAATIHAFIELPGRPGLNCIIRDISEGGALIELFECAELPKTFGLRLPKSNILVDCVVARSDGAANRFGVAFKPQHGVVGAVARRALRSAGTQLSAS